MAEAVERMDVAPAVDVAPLLQVSDLNAWYGESHVLHGISFDVLPGEVVTLLGRNGAGKTTTLRSIIGVLRKRRGSIRFTGCETIDLPSNAIARLGIGYCPEERGIFSSLSVAENLTLPPIVRRSDDRADLHAVSQSEGAPGQPGHQTVWWRTADAGNCPHPADRCASAAAG